MIRFLIKKAKFYKHSKTTKKQEFALKNKQDKIMLKSISADLQKNTEDLKTIFGDSHDFKSHELKFGPDNSYMATVVYIDGLADMKVISNTILKALISYESQTREKFSGSDLIKHIKEEILYSVDITEESSYEEIGSSCLGGNTVILLDGCEVALIVNSVGWEKRAITEPQSETVVRGPREGFTENLKTNTTLIRRKIKSDKLRVEHMTIGDKTNTDVYLLYLDGVAKKIIIDTVKERLNKIKVDSILESGYIEQYIEDAPFSPFATVGYSEKPDVVAAKILEGRVAIIVDGTPFVLTAPMMFVESFQTSEDYYSRPFQVNINRIIRLLGYFVSVFFPGIFIALSSYHQELIPTTLLVTIAKAREGTPFPVFIEAITMVFAFEILRETGIRLPRPVGQAISIVGALIMGDAAVSAGLVGAPVVVTIALTAVASFLVPNQSDSSGVIRLMIMILAASLGLFGVLMGAITVLIHLCSLQSFGVPYFDAFEPSRDLQDSLVRVPLWSMSKRPRYLVEEDETRQNLAGMMGKGDSAHSIENNETNANVAQGKNGEQNEKN
jgi:spore germination protein KA